MTLAPYREFDESTQSSRAKAVVSAIADRPLPSPRRLVREAGWWVRRLQRIVPWLPVIVLREIRPTLRGIARAAAAWARWVRCVELAESIKAAEGNERSRAAERLAKRRSARAWGSVVALAIAVGGLVWVYTIDPLWLLFTAVVLVCIFDGVGHIGQPAEETGPLPVATLPVLTDATPLSQITAEILTTLEREGFAPDSVAVASSMTWDEARREYRIRLKLADELKREHLRAIERSIGAKDGVIRNLATDTASVRELVIPVGDPLAHVPPPPYIATGTRSITDPLDLGVAAGDVPFELTFAGVHAAVVGMTGSGKTKGFLTAVIDRLSACRDVVLWGIDLSAGPALALWRGVIQRKAFDPEAAEELLDDALAEIRRRMRVLADLAEDDDPDNDTDEWHSGLGPALVIIIDEYPLLTEFGGKAGRPDLLGKTEQIIRVGRKVWVTLVLGLQKTGNSDFGSTLMSTQIGIKVAMACSERDAGWLFGVEARDRGWAPHLLSPAVKDDPRDAGKCYVQSPAHHTPDVYRTYAPMPPGEIKRRARQRLDDGLPRLRDLGDDIVDVVTIPPLLAAIADVFAARSDEEWIRTDELLKELFARGHQVRPQDIGNALRVGDEKPGTRKRLSDGTQAWGYSREAVERKLRSLD